MRMESEVLNKIEELNQELLQDDSNNTWPAIELEAKINALKWVTNQIKEL